jgi:proteasome regulatory subunit
MQLLAGMDGFDRRGDVKIIGATNRIDILDRALLRPGRFDRIIEIPLPDTDGRFAILAIHTKGMNLDKAINLKEVSRATEGKNGADLKAICTEAGMFAIRSDRTTVTQQDFMAAIEKVSVDFSKHQLTTSYGAMFA